MPKHVDSKLKIYRDCIDKIDEQILALLNRRIGEARSIGEIKAQQSEPEIYRPEREANVLKRLQKLNQGPLDNTQLETLFREIMSITRGAEAGLSVAILGPLGTYTELAARRHFGSLIALVPYASIGEIFRAAETAQTDFAVVPVENSTEGGVSSTLDRLVTTSLLVCGEINLRIQHNLLGRGKQLCEIKRVLAHPQSLAQCKSWLARKVPGIELIATSSNAEAAHQAQKDPTSAAIAGASAAERYALNHLASNIEDDPGNATRFLVLSNRPVPPSGEDKTSLLLSCHNRPGALFNLLKPLLEHQVNMTKIESRPSKTGLWDYLFFVDIVGHRDDAKIAKALQEMEAEAGLYKNLGSYPFSS